MNKIIRFGMKMTRLRLRTRIFLGFGVLIALLLGIAGYGSYGLSVVGEEIDKMDGIAGNTSRSQELALRMEQLRRGVADYQINAEPDALKDIAAAATRATALLKDSAEFTLSDKRRAMFNGIIEKLHAFTASQAHFAEMRDTIATQRGKLLDAAKTLAAARKQLADAAIAGGDTSDAAPVAATQLALLTAENSSSRFLGTLDQAWVQDFKKDSALAEQALATLGGSSSAGVRSVLPTVVSAFNLYATVFDKTAAAMLEGDIAYNTEIRPVIREMQRATSDSLDKLTKAFSLTSQKAATISSSSLTQQLELSAGATLIGLVLAFLIARTIIRPINSMTAAMSKLATGDTASVVPGRNRTDEIGEMAQAVEVFRQQAIEKIELSMAQAREQSAKERRQKAMDLHTQEFGSSVSGVMDSFMAASASMRQAASEVADGARQTRASTSATVEGAMSSGRDLNAVAAAAEQMAASINEISSQVAHVTTSVKAAVDRAAETDAKVVSLSQTADRIGDVVRIISDIAGQTNLLALNATIEAARAGEAGKGFAVVAGEVKALATQTAQATNQIGTQIVAIRSATTEAVAAVRDVGTAISQVEAVAAAIAAAVEEQASATREITNSVQMVTANTSNATDAMRAVLSIVEGTDASSLKALQASEEVGRTAETLRTEVTDFLTAVSRGDDAERRLYERIPGGGTQAKLHIAGRPATTVIIQDISRGGVGLAYNCSDPIGTDVEVTLPDGGTVAGRIARASRNSLGISFRQDQASLTRIEQALAFIRKKSAA